ncbi:unnamed protein product [Fraxinus pennsylvanica]|uniref:Retrotransposon Copia-like N-terminal domain-containing protein n=1 Tax=Fraxinus pennsylvanica TaxID=56036 RepID=A0AAD1ZJ15_9LAMI|nr:unnamed protein product [Fraxinus pennsylvanica]
MVGDMSDNFIIAPEKLTGRNNYDSWARIVRMSIARKKKLGYITGLDSHLDGARAHVLRSDPLPDVLETYAMICEEDTRLKTMGSEENTSGSALAARKGKEGSLYESPKPFFKSGSGGSNSAKDERKCTHCNGKNHIVDKCWKLHGRPDWTDELITKKQGSRASLATTPTIENEDEAKSGSTYSGGDWTWF